jgi:hypothetical protein
MHALMPPTISQPAGPPHGHAQRRGQPADHGERESPVRRRSRASREGVKQVVVWV